MEPKLKVLFGIAISALLSIAIYLRAWHLVPLFFATIFAFAAPFMGSSAGTEDSGKSRLKCLYLSFLPGAGHIYLGRYRTSVPYVAALFVSMFILMLAVPFINDVIYLIMLFSLTYFSAAMIAAINVESICDEIGLLHENEAAEMNIKNRPRAYALSVILPYSLLVATAACCWVTNTICEYPIYIISLTAWTVAAVVSVTLIVWRKGA